MRKFVFILMLVLIQLRLYGQDRKLTVAIEQQPLRMLFQEIQKQCGYSIVYSDEVVSDTIRVSGNFQSLAVSSVLQQVLSGKNLFYRLLSEKMIIIGSNKDVVIPVNGAEQTLFSGQVLNPEGLAVPFSTVSLIENQVQINGAIGENTGNFKFTQTLDPKKNYALKISCIGYETLLLNFSLPDVSVETKFFGKLVLKPKMTVLKDIQVSASQPIIEMSGGNIVFNVSKSIIAQGSNALELLARAPGVSVGTDNSISLNGKSGVAILIDGKLTYLSGNDIAELLKSMSSSDIRSIEIINSPGAKYDASGTAGIINVKTQKAMAQDFNAALTSGLSYGVYLRNNQNLSFSYRKNRLNLFGSYNHFLGYYSYLYGADRIQEGKFYNSFTDDVDKRNKMGSRLGADFAIDKKQTVGLLLNGNFIFGGGITDTRTEIGTAGGTTVDQTLTAINDYYQQQTQRYNVNLNYKYEDTLGRVINFDADYGSFTKGSGNLQSNTYTTPDQAVLSDNLYRSVNAIDIGLKAVKLDYAANLWKGKIETGARYSSVTAGNDSRFLEVQPGGELLDPSRSNHFVYTEAISSAYLSYNRKVGHWTLESGLRVENSASSGKLDAATPVSGNQLVTDRNYTNFFPNVSVSLKPSAAHSFSLSYSKRIDRPAYQDLNPFIYLLDELSYWQGNPFLQPELSHTGLLQYAYKSSTIVGLSYSYITDFSVEVTDTVGQTSIVMVPRNLGTQKHLALRLSQTLKPYPWWSINFNGTVYRLNNTVDFGGGRKLNLNQTAATLSLQQSFKLPYGLSTEVAGYFNSKRLIGANQFIGITSQVDLGLQRSFMNQKAVLRIVFADIYKGTKANSVQSVGGLYIHNYSYFEGRQIKLNFSYRFNTGNSKNPRSRTSALESENGRIK